MLLGSPGVRRSNLVAPADQSLTVSLRQPRRLLAIALLALAGGLVVAFDYARAENAGADAIAYWWAVHQWLAGGDPYATTIDPTQASGHILPYAYPPWTLVLFLPWALLPWDVAWLLWRWTGVLLFAWTVRWAYQRRPLAAAVLIAILAPPIAANFDTGNANIFLVVIIWAAQFVGPRLGGLLWALCSALKWLPAALVFVLRPPARGWGVAILAVFTLMTLATWPMTLRQIEVALFYPRPLRLDYLMLAWAAVPWLWRQPWPPWWLQSREFRARLTRRRPPLRSVVRAFFGLAVIAGLIALAGCSMVRSTVPPSAAPSSAPAPSAGRSGPNILLIIADDFGIDSSPCYDVGEAKPEMPNLERLCREGVVFDTVWVNPACTPTRATLLTGQYGFRTNVLHVDDVLSDQIESVQDVLSRDVPVPYRNAVIGKWHVSGGRPPPTAPAGFGVHRYAGFLSGSLRPGTYFDWNFVIDGAPGHTNTYATTWMTDAAAEWIAHQQDGPWFLWLAYNAPHAPFHLPPAGLAHNTAGLSGLESDIEANSRPYFLAMAEALDTEMGRLLDSFEPTVRENTTIMFIADNGTERGLAQPPFSFNRAKGSLYDGGLHVPLVVAGSGVERRGEREDALVNGVDVPATILRLAGYPESDFHDGVSFDRALTDSTFNGRRFIYADGIRAEPNNGPSGWAVRDRRHELIEYESGENELYDLAADPGTTTNLLAQPLPAELDALVREMEAYKASL